MAKNKPTITAPAKKILLAIPKSQNMTFWLQVEYFARVVAQSLDVELHIHLFQDGDKNRYQYAASIEKVIKQQFKPDAIVSIFWLHGEAKLLALSQKYRIPLITFNSQLNSDTIKRIGRPRQNYRYWRASLSPNDIALGEITSERLLGQMPKHKPIKLFAIAGDTSSAPSLDRLKGLNISLKRHPNATVLNTIHTSWNTLIAKHKTLSLLKRYDPNDIQFIWAASNALALGAISALEHRGYLPGQHILIGGIDWTPESIRLIREGKLLFSLGGHFIEAGKAILLAHEILHGFDFDKDLGTVIHTKASELNQANCDTLAPKLQGSHWKTIDFKQFSKHYNSKLSRYQLDIEDLLDFNQR